MPTLKELDQLYAQQFAPQGPLRGAQPLAAPVEASAAPAGGSALGRALLSLIPFGEIARKAVSGEKVSAGEFGLEAGLSALPLGIGKVAKLAKGAKAAKAGADVAKTGRLGKLSEDLAVRGLRPAPGQLTSFRGDHGEDLAKTLVRHRLEGADVEGIREVIKPLQQSFDEIADNADVVVDPKTIRSAFDNVIKPLKKSSVLEEQRLAKSIEAERDSVLKTINNKPTRLGELNAQRKRYDAVTKSYRNDPVLAGPNRASGTALRNLVQESADTAGLRAPGGQTLKDTGRELSRLYDVEKIADRQSDLGRGSNPLGIIPSIAASGGLGAGGLMAGGPVGGLAGALAGVGVSKAINSPRVIRAASRASGAAARGLESGPGRALATAGKVELSRAPLIGAYNLQGQGAEAAGSVPAQPVAETELIPTDVPQEPVDDLSAQLVDMAMQAYQAGDTKGLERIAKLQDIVGTTAPKAAKAPSGEQQKRQASAKAGIRALDRVEALLSQDPSKPVKSKVPGQFGARDYAAVSREVMDAISRLRTGAALTKQEIGFYEQYLPQPLDDAQTKQLKLRQLREFFNDTVGAEQTTDLSSLIAELS